MLKWLSKRIGRFLRHEKSDIGSLYYLMGIKPLGASKTIIDECTVSME